MEDMARYLRILTLVSCLKEGPISFEQGGADFDKYKTFLRDDTGTSSAVYYIVQHSMPHPFNACLVTEISTSGLITVLNNKSP